MSTVYSSLKRPRPVKNLGWLRRHWKDVRHFEVVEPGTVVKPSWDPVYGSIPTPTGGDCVLVAHLYGGGAYVTSFASREVLAWFLRRPVFYGLDVLWFAVKRRICRASECRDLTLPGYLVLQEPDPRDAERRRAATFAPGFAGNLIDTLKKDG